MSGIYVVASQLYSKDKNYDMNFKEERGKLKKPDHADLHNKCRICAPLLQLMKFLDRSNPTPLRKSYCGSINQLLVREVRDLLPSDSASTNELKIRISTREDRYNLSDVNMLPIKSTINVLNMMKSGQVNRVVKIVANVQWRHYAANQRSHKLEEAIECINLSKGRQQRFDAFETNCYYPSLVNLILKCWKKLNSMMENVCLSSSLAELFINSEETSAIDTNEVALVSNKDTVVDEDHYVESNEDEEAELQLAPIPPKMLCMANFCVIGGHVVIGVAEIHSEIVKQDVFKDLY
ncbi:Alpha-1,4 glucan phosphorylase L isozyme, chloroplastic/amyloplastic [Artemisia annua]|uniref:Alpha-1,4 glucan phosphorylase L isozyme, chloroplastic/amyloplastic n=1 Tax=Artemisia annua TaxID=35608 RepID=A0A2U1NVP5_ARTAN|nr:Alpha-1,4 glucan phosphorylase L isozyme, chloroplastic/amyloplastic [Artemisia annua]